MILRLLLAAGILAGVTFAAIESPIFGFAGLTAGAALLVGAPLILSRMQNERPYFFGPKIAGLAVPLLLPMAIFGAMIRAVAVGAVALFAIPGDLTANGQQFEGSLGIYAAQLNHDREFMVALFLLVVLIGIVVVGFLHRATAGRGRRWGFFRLAFIFGLIFSVGIFIVENGPGLQPTSEKRFETFAPPSTLVALAVFENLTDTVTAQERERERQRKCAATDQVPEGLGRRTVYKARWRCDRQTGGKTYETLIGDAVLVFSILDEYADALIADLVGEGAAASFALPGEATKNIASIFLSSNLIQGMTLSIWVTLLSMIIYRGNPQS